MIYSVITLTPDVINNYCKTGIINKAIQNGTISVNTYNLLDYSKTPCKKVYGGGPNGMVITAPSILAAYNNIGVSTPYDESKKTRTKVFIMSASGTPFTNVLAKQISKDYSHIILISGRFEGVDYRIKSALSAEEISIGDYILSNGDLACNIMIDCISRQYIVKSLEENREQGSPMNSSHIFTRPESFEYNNKIYSVPKELLSGNPSEIKKWQSKNEN
jgi:tRNA (guanine37-N1)-methyltransferase